MTSPSNHHQMIHDTIKSRLSHYLNLISPFFPSPPWPPSVAPVARLLLRGPGLRRRCRAAATSRGRAASAAQSEKRRQRPPGGNGKRPGERAGKTGENRGNLGKTWENTRKIWKTAENLRKSYGKWMKMGEKLMKTPGKEGKKMSGRLEKHGSTMFTISSI